MNIIEDTSAILYMENSKNIALVTIKYISY